MALFLWVQRHNGATALRHSGLMASQSGTSTNYQTTRLHTVRQLPQGAGPQDGPPAGGHKDSEVLRQKRATTYDDSSIENVIMNLLHFRFVNHSS